MPCCVSTSIREQVAAKKPETSNASSLDLPFMVE
jgi:hypothetical protein